MAKITVWSKQHENVWKVLQETGRYTVKREYIIKDLKEHSELVLEQTGGCGISGMGILQAGCNDASGKRKSDPGTGDRRIPDYQSEFHKMGNDSQLFLYSGRQGG